jgi:outer membrane lipoprotein carrier protein
MRFALLFAVLFSASASVFGAAIDQFRAFVRGTQSARAEFEQKVHDRAGNVTQESRGSFVFQRPGLFRWVYAKPVDQVIVGDGERVWIHDRDLNQVTVRKLSRALGSTPAALLAGSADIEKAFELSEAGSRDGLEWMEARPREREAGFERVRMGFDGKGLRAMELVDHFGQTTVLRFSNLVRNPKLDKSEFRFEPPKGADVLGDK